MSCNDQKQNELIADVYETSASGNQLTLVTEFEKLDSSTVIKINPDKKFQTIT